jgi:hypothetical protein
VVIYSPFELVVSLLHSLYLKSAHMPGPGWPFRPLSSISLDESLIFQPAAF